jgi:hypothetical protein
MSPMTQAQTLMLKKDLKPMFADSMRIILCPEATAVDTEHTLICKTFSTCYVK